MASPNEEQPPAPTSAPAPSAAAVPCPVLPRPLAVTDLTRWVDLRHCARFLRIACTQHPSSTSELLGTELLRHPTPTLPAPTPPHGTSAVRGGTAARRPARPPPVPVSHRPVDPALQASGHQHEQSLAQELRRIAPTAPCIAGQRSVTWPRFLQLLAAASPPPPAADAPAPQHTAASHEPQTTPGLPLHNPNIMPGVAPATGTGTAARSHTMPHPEAAAAACSERPHASRLPTGAAAAGPQHPPVHIGCWAAEVWLQCCPAEGGAVALRGRADFVLLLWRAGRPVLRVVECKASRRARASHFHQVLCYRAMLRRLLRLGGTAVAATASAAAPAAGVGVGGASASRSCGGVDAQEQQGDGEGEQRRGGAGPRVVIGGVAWAAEEVEVECVLHTQRPGRAGVLAAEPLAGDKVLRVEEQLSEWLRPGGAVRRALDARGPPLSSLPYTLAGHCATCGVSAACWTDAAARGALQLAGCGPRQAAALAAAGVCDIEALAELPVATPASTAPTAAKYTFVTAAAAAAASAPATAATGRGERGTGATEGAKVAEQGVGLGEGGGAGEGRKGTGTASVIPRLEDKELLRLQLAARVRRVRAREVQGALAARAAERSVGTGQLGGCVPGRVGEGPRGPLQQHPALHSPQLQEFALIPGAHASSLPNHYVTAWEAAGATGWHGRQPPPSPPPPPAEQAPGEACATPQTAPAENGFPRRPFGPLSSPPPTQPLCAETPTASPSTPQRNGTPPGGSISWHNFQAAAEGTPSTGALSTPMSLPPTQPLSRCMGNPTNPPWSVPPTQPLLAAYPAPPTQHPSHSPPAASPRPSPTPSAAAILTEEATEEEEQLMALLDRMEMQQEQQQSQQWEQQQHLRGTATSEHTPAYLQSQPKAASPVPPQTGCSPTAPQASASSSPSSPQLPRRRHPLVRVYLAVTRDTVLRRLAALAAHVACDAEDVAAPSETAAPTAVTAERATSSSSVKSVHQELGSHASGCGGGVSCEGGGDGGRAAGPGGTLRPPRPLPPPRQVDQRGADVVEVLGGGGAVALEGGAKLDEQEAALVAAFVGGLVGAVRRAWWGWRHAQCRRAAAGVTEAAAAAAVKQGCAGPQACQPRLPHHEHGGSDCQYYQQLVLEDALAGVHFYVHTGQEAWFLVRRCAALAAALDPAAAPERQDTTAFAPDRTDGNNKHHTEPGGSNDPGALRGLAAGQQQGCAGGGEVGMEAAGSADCSSSAEIGTGVQGLVRLLQLLPEVLGYRVAVPSGAGGSPCRGRHAEGVPELRHVSALEEECERYVTRWHGTGLTAAAAVRWAPGQQQVQQQEQREGQQQQQEWEGTDAVGGRGEVFGWKLACGGGVGGVQGQGGAGVLGLGAAGVGAGSFWEVQVEAPAGEQQGLRPLKRPWAGQHHHQQQQQRSQRQYHTVRVQVGPDVGSQWLPPSVFRAAWGVGMAGGVGGAPHAAVCQQLHGVLAAQVQAVRWVEERLVRLPGGCGVGPGKEEVGEAGEVGAAEAGEVGAAGAGAGSRVVRLGRLVDELAAAARGAVASVQDVNGRG